VRSATRSNPALADRAWFSGRTFVTPGSDTVHTTSVHGHQRIAGTLTAEILQPSAGSSACQRTHV